MTKDTLIVLFAMLSMASGGLVLKHAWASVQQRRWTRAARAYVMLLLRHQYRVASTQDIDDFIGWARSRKSEAFVREQFDLAEQSHSAGLREGHLWAVAWKVRGLLSREALLPACNSKGHGIETMPGIEDTWDRVGAVTLMKSWAAHRGG